MSTPPRANDANGDPADDEVDRLFARYLHALERRDGLDPEVEERLVARFVRRAGPLAEPFLRRVRTMRRLASMARADAPPRDHGLAPGQRIGRYEVIEELSEGGAARVLRARDPLLQRDVVLKWIHTDPDGDARRREYLTNDARALARLEHPSIVRVLDVDTDRQRVYIVMEWVRGPSLARILSVLAARRRGESLPALPDDLVAAVDRLEPVMARVRLVERLAEALALCHANGVIHRDIKPSNILVRTDGAPVLIDFGIAHFEGSAADVTENLVGTPGYLAPEQVAASRTGVSPTSDVFSLGVVLYELLALTQPFERDTRELTLAAVMLAEVTPLRSIAPSISRDLARICSHALERDPRERYPSMDAFASDLCAARELRRLSVPAPRLLDTTVRHLRRLKRGGRRIVAVTTIAAAVAILVLLGEHWTRANAIRDALALAHGQCDDLEGLDEAGRALVDIERHIRALERSIFGRFVSRDIRPGLEDTRRRFSTVLAAHLDADIESHAARGTSMVWSSWRALLALDERVNPRGLTNLANRQRGMLFLPPDARDARLEIHLPRPRGGMSTGLLALPFTGTLEPGLYRISDLDESGVPRRQVELRVDPRDRDSPARRVELRHVVQGFHSGAVAVPARTVRIGGQERAIEVAPVWVSRDVVRVRDLVPWILRERPPGIAMQLDVNDLDAPALLSWDQAVAFAHSCGLRLPTALEWQGAALTEGFRWRDDTGMTSDRLEGITAEHLAGPPESEWRAPRYADLTRFEAVPGDWAETDPTDWTYAPTGRPGGLLLRMPRQVRTAIAELGSGAASELAPVAYRSVAFRLATNVPPPREDDGLARR